MYRLCSVALAVALLLWEGRVAVQALWRPHVSRFYADYYIHQTRTCWLPEVEQPGIAASLRQTTLQVPRLTAPQRCYVLMSGWTHDEPWGVWSSKKAAWLDVPAPSGAQVLTLHLVPVPASQAQRVAMSVGDAAPQDFIIPPGGLDVTVPASTETIILLRPAGSLFAGLHLGLSQLSWH
jgi:hypothetical protein